MYFKSHSKAEAGSALILGGKKNINKRQGKHLLGEHPGDPQPHVPESAGVLPAPSRGGCAVPVPHWCEVTGKM